MNYLGVTRSITQDYKTHQVAEDYSGTHKTIIKINGTGKVIKVINRFFPHEDSINYNTFLKNQNKWWNGSEYVCVSITGKTVRMKPDEVGGNQIWIETYYNGLKRIFHLAHLAQVNVEEGDIVTKDTILGLQGNTGLVLSGKSEKDVTYGTHVHLEVKDEKGNYINPRGYASFQYETTYPINDNGKNIDNDQIHILVKQINIRKLPNETSEDLGDVYYNEYYDILGTVDTEKYIWYKIKTNTEIEGYVAGMKGANWLEVLINDNILSSNPSLEFLLEATKSDEYSIMLNSGDRVYIQRKS